MRENLKKARSDKGVTQQAMADALGITLRYYKALESGERLGGIEHWDKLEDLLTSIRQRQRRSISPPGLVMDSRLRIVKQLSTRSLRNGQTLRWLSICARERFLHCQSLNRT